MDLSFWKGKKILITGHTGFKGTWLTFWLSQLKAEITGYALDPPTKPSVFKLSGVSGSIHDLRGDIRDLEKLRQAVLRAQPEIIFHLAAQPLVIESYKDPVGTYGTNVMGTVNLLEAARHVEGLKAVVVITSDKCYENQEWLWGYREDEKLGGHDPYSNSKACAELVTSCFRDSFFQDVTRTKSRVLIASARAGNVIGGGDWALNRLVPDCAASWLRGNTVKLRYPNATRPWQFVMEPLAGYLALAQKLWEGNEQFEGGWNFGPESRDVKSVQWVVERLSHHWNEKANWEVIEADYLYEANFLKLDCSKAKADLGWKPRWDLDRTLRGIAAWYEAYKTSPEAVRKLMQLQIHEFATSLSQNNDDE